MAARSVDTLLRDAIDYAGMFAPASLDADAAERAYARHRGGDHRWITGAFVVAADRLAELAPTTRPLSVVTTAGSPADVERVLRRGDRGGIAALEFRPLPAPQIASVAAAAPRDIACFFEVPAGGELEIRLDAIAKCGGLAKIRTGGVTPEAFPSAAAVYGFFNACAERGVAAKATAGLHHALTGCYPLTYEPSSASAPMYGFLNVCTAAALVHAGSDEDEVCAALHESTAEAFAFEEDGMTWRTHRFSVEHLKSVRESVFRSFGSCSLREPIDELTRMQLL